MAELLVEMTGISKSFPGVHALDGCGFELRPGEVHALVGENGAGKSTIMKILAGIYRRDAGTIRFKGQEVEIASPRAAQDLGISIIHQELNLMGHLTVAQNIFIGREPRGAAPFLLDEKTLNAKASDLFETLHIKLDPRARVSRLAVAQQQMVEIAKALSFSSDVLIMDEPTAALTETEIDELFRITRHLRERGHGIVHISHRLEELKRITDRVTVMRDGRYVDTVITADASIGQIISMMVGRTVFEATPELPETVDPNIVLDVRGLNLGRQVRDISFQLHRGEILGVAGPDEAGDAQDLAAMELEADVPHLAAQVEAPHIEHDVRVDRLGQLGCRLEDGPPDHHADDLPDAGIGRDDRVDIAAVPHDRHAVGDPLELLQAVRDVHDAVAPLAQVPRDAEELVDLGLGERRRGLVHDQDVRAERERLRDLDHLLLRHGEPGHACRRVEVQVELLEQLGGLAVERLVVQHEAAARLPADEDVLGHGQVAHEVQLLVDDRDPQVLRGPGREDLDLGAPHLDRPGVALVDPGQDLHQRGLPRAVLADQGVDLTGTELEAAVVERVNAREALADAGHLDQELSHRGFSLGSCAPVGQVQDRAPGPRGTRG